MADNTNLDDENKVGKGEGGADSTGSGNILAGVQPDEGEDENGEERREGAPSLRDNVPGRRKGG